MLEKYIGMTKATSNGSTLKVTAVTSDHRLLIECSVCSKDKELFPDGFTSLPGNFNAGHAPCGCSRAPRWNEKQWEVRVKRACRKYNYKFLGWAESFRGVSTKVRLLNMDTDIEWSTTCAKTIVSQKVYPPIRNDGSKNVNIISCNEHIKRFMATGSFPEGVKFERDPESLQHWFVICPKCESDEYSKAGCDIKFRSLQQNLSRGVAPCRCNEGKTKDRKESELDVSNKLSLIGGLFLGWDGEYSSTKSTVVWRCSNGHTCKTNMRSIMYGDSGCSHCASSGFKRSKDAVFYIGFWGEGSENFIKYGITNDLSISTRINTQKNKSSLKLKFVVKSNVMNGDIVFNAEKQVKRMFRNETHCSKELMPDGFTETVLDTKDNRSAILNLLKSFGFNFENVERYGYGLV